MALYKYVVPKPKDQCNKVEQLGVSFAAGYIAGVFCAVVSHPADNLVRVCYCIYLMKGSSAHCHVSRLEQDCPLLSVDDATAPKL